MQVGAQGIIREVLLPKTRRELGDPGSGVLRDPLQDVNEIRVGIYAVQATGDQQALDDADVAGAELGPAKEP